MNTEIIQFLTDLGYNTKQAQIYLTLYQIGSSPASTVAIQAGYERVYTYKALQAMSEDGIIAQTRKSSTTHFYIPDESPLLSYIIRHQARWSGLADRYPIIQTQLQSLRTGSLVTTPKIQLYDGSSQIAHLFHDIQHEITRQGLLSINVFATHTFQEQIISDKIVSDYLGSLVQYVDDHHIMVHNYVAEGGLIMEQIRSYPGIEKLGELPAGDHALNIMIIGQIVYIVIYRGSPIGLKLSSPEFARAINFILSQTTLSS